jgi:hypothetical protein
MRQKLNALKLEAMGNYRSSDGELLPTQLALIIGFLLIDY